MIILSQFKRFYQTLAILTLSHLFAPASVAHENHPQTSPLRLISAGSTITELLYALEADDQIVAVDLTSRHYIQPDKDKPILGYHRQLSAEGILALNPTHLIGSSEMGPDSSLNLLNAAGVKIETLPTGHHFADFKTRLKYLAELTHTETKAKSIYESVEQQLSKLKQSQPNQKPKTIFVMATKGRPLTLAGDNTAINSMIELAGGINPIQEKTTGYKPYTIEAILEMQPEYILISERSIQLHESLSNLIEQHPLLKLTPAYQKNQIISVSGQAILGGLGLSSFEFAQTLNQRFMAQKHQYLGKP